MFDLRQNADAQKTLVRDTDRLLPVYARYPVVMDHGNGVYLYDTSGNRYLDLMAGLGVNALGHAHPRMVAAMADQAGKIVHLSPQYASRYPGELAERLCQLSGMKGVFYSTGGSEAARTTATPSTASSRSRTPITDVPTVRSRSPARRSTASTSAPACPTSPSSNAPA